MNTQPTPPSAASVQTISSTKMAVALMFLGAAIVAAAATFSLTHCPDEIIPGISLKTSQFPGLTMGDIQKTASVASFASLEHDISAVKHFYTQPIQGGSANVTVQYFEYHSSAIAKDVAGKLLTAYAEKETTPEIAYSFTDDSNTFLSGSFAGCLTSVTERQPLGIDCFIQKDAILVQFTLSDVAESSTIPGILLTQLGKNMREYQMQCSLVNKTVTKPDLVLSNMVIKKDHPGIEVKTPDNAGSAIATVTEEVETLTIGVVLESDIGKNIPQLQLSAKLKNPSDDRQALRPFTTFNAIPTVKHNTNWTGTASIITVEDISFDTAKKYLLTFTMDVPKALLQLPDLETVQLVVEVDSNQQFSESNENNNMLRLELSRASASPEPTIISAEFVEPNDSVTVGAGQEFCVVVKGKYTDAREELVFIKHRGDNSNPSDVTFSFNSTENIEVRPLTCAAGDGYGIVAPTEVGEYILTVHMLRDSEYSETPLDRLAMKVVDSEEDACPEISGTQSAGTACAVEEKDVCPDIEGIQTSAADCPKKETNSGGSTNSNSQPVNSGSGGGSSSGSSSGGGSSGGGGGGAAILPAAPTVQVPSVSAGTGGSTSPVQINQGAKTTSINSVTLTMPTTNADQMAISNTANFSGASWQPLKKTVNWELTSGTGKKTVYIKFRNSKTGGVTGVYSSTIDVVAKTAQQPKPVSAPSPKPTPVSCALTPGKAYKTANSPAIYYVTSQCTKRPFKNSVVFFTYFTAWSEVQTVSTLPPNDAIQFMPWGPKYNPKSGALVKVPEDPKVYLLLNGKKYWITSESVFTGLGYQWNWIEDADPTLLNSFQTVGELSLTNVHMDGTVFKYPNSPKVYVLVGGKKSWIVNEAAFNKLGYRWDRIVTIPVSETYPNGADLK